MLNLFQPHVFLHQEWSFVFVLWFSKKEKKKSTTVYTLGKLVFLMTTVMLYCAATIYVTGNKKQTNLQGFT